MNIDTPETNSSTASPAAAPRPNLPPIPAGNTTARTITPPDRVAHKTEDPTWWRVGAIPYIVLMLAAAAADLYWPRVGCIGIGAGIAGILFTTAVLLLRKDLSIGEICFLSALAGINCIALTVSGNPLNYFIGLIVPFFLVAMPSPHGTQQTVGVRYRSWWSYWTTRREKKQPQSKRFLKQILPTLISLLLGAAMFISFLTIFASGNPIVEKVWQWIVTKWNEILSYLNISWDFMIHLLYWAVGVIIFGIYARRRPYAPTIIRPATKEAPGGTTLLPHLPLFTLIGINLAFLIATATDITYLWFKNIPEGISQTQYLHEGADSIIWASILAAAVLIILFRSTGIARQSKAAKAAAYLLIFQTFLLAASVYLRLYYQICDYGFTYRRILAGESLLLGLVGLMILLFYIATEARFWRCAKVCLGTMILLVIAGGIISPTRLAATLNLQYKDANPHWKFEARDFDYGRFSAVSHLAFAEMIYQQNPNQYMAKNLLLTARGIVERENAHSGWTTFTLNHSLDLPVAHRILQDESIAQLANEHPERPPFIYRTEKN